MSATADRIPFVGVVKPITYRMIESLIVSALFYEN
jgi:hypothetical protein